MTRKNRKTSCPLKHLSNTLGGKWKLPVICVLSEGDTPKRYSVIRRRLAGITNVMLTKSLRELEDDGIIQREQYNEIPPRVEYSLTDKGKETLPFLTEAAMWAINDLKREGTDIFCGECQNMK